MKGKTKNKRKIGKVILIGIGFFLTIVLTFTTTLAWFYDSDWASKYIKMGGSVGIKIMDSDNKFTSGTGNLHFNITTDKAYPGQSVDVSASVYNYGGKSTTNGSDCYVRAKFAVYTNIGMAPDPADYITDDYPDGTDNPQYIKDLASSASTESELNAEALYAFLNNLITKQNALSGTTNYYWKYYERTGTLALSDTGVGTDDMQYYLNGQKYSTAQDALSDGGYFYLCNDENGVLKSLSAPSTEGAGETATFLWNSTFTIPWQLTNLSADKYIYIALSFQAVQTFIPKITNGVIDSAANNQLPASECLYNSEAVQTVFSSCAFAEVPTTIEIDGQEINFADASKFATSSKPSSTNP